jgi:NADH dehydrogenase
MIFLAGSTGFIGRHVAEALRDAGRAVRCLLRPDSEREPQEQQRQRERLTAAGFQTVSANVCDHEALSVLMDGCVAVVNLVGATMQGKRQQFQQSHVEATERLLEAARVAGVQHFVQMSALGASPESPSHYHRTKWQSEQLVRAGGVPWTILRASVVVGAGDIFTNMIIDLLERPLVAVVPCDGETRLQPVAVTDVARAIVGVLTEGPPEGGGRVLDLGGPVALKFSEMVDVVAGIYGHAGRPIRIPPTMARPWAFVAQALRSKRAITLDQLRVLTVDSVTDYEKVRRTFGFEFVGYEVAVRDAIASRIAAEAVVEARQV